MVRFAGAALAAVFLLLCTSQSEARRRAVDVPSFDRHTSYAGYYGPVSSPRRQASQRHSGRHASKSSKRVKVAHRGRNAAGGRSGGEAQLLPHPVGCPASRFCGCGAAIEVFGRNIRELWLAANWFRFPPAAPAPGMVAVRRHHVFVIREVRGNGMVLAYDANSGGRRTRLHLRSLAGYSVRNPHGSKYATAG